MISQDDTFWFKRLYMSEFQNQWTDLDNFCIILMMNQCYVVCTTNSNTMLQKYKNCRRYPCDSFREAVTNGLDITCFSYWGGGLLACKFLPFRLSRVQSTLFFPKPLGQRLRNVWNSEKTLTCDSMNCVSPWYNWNDWLDVKKQLLTCLHDSI